MKILITGGAGFIGSKLAQRMISRGNQVILLDNLSPQIHGPDASFPSTLAVEAHCVKGDVGDTDTLHRAAADVEAIVHLAAETGTGQSMYEVERYSRTNIQGTAVLLDMLVNRRPRHLTKLVVASSRAIYGEGQYGCGTCGVVYPKPRSASAMSAGRFEAECPKCGSGITVQPTGEDAPMSPSSFYGLSKQVQEQMVLMFSSTLGMDAVALRYQNVYGPGQSLRNSYTGLLAVFSNLVRQGKPLDVFEDGLESRDFVYIEDVIEATAACLEPEVHGIHALNVGSGTRTSVKNVAHAVRHFFRSAVPIRVTGQFRLGDIRHNVADISRIRALTGFEPKWTFEAGLDRFLDWAMQSDACEAGFEQSLREMRERGLFRGAD